MFSTKSLMHKNPKFAIVTTGFMAAVLTLSMLTTAITFSSPLASALTLPGNQTSSTGGKNMTMPGGNMTFGTSLQNAKMHLMEAIMDLKTGNTKATMMELNLTAQGIKMHEQEIKSMMMGMKGNATSPSTMSKNATS